MQSIETAVEGQVSSYLMFYDHSRFDFAQRENNIRE